MQNSGRIAGATCQCTFDSDVVACGHALESTAPSGSWHGCPRRALDVPSASPKRHRSCAAIVRISDIALTLWNAPAHRACVRGRRGNVRARAALASLSNCARAANRLAFRMHRHMRSIDMDFHAYSRLQRRRVAIVFHMHATVRIDNATQCLVEIEILSGTLGQL